MRQERVRPRRWSATKDRDRPSLVDTLEELNNRRHGGPEAAVLWVCKLPRDLAGALVALGLTDGQKLDGKLLRKLGYGL